MGSLDNRTVQTLLDELHEKASGDSDRWNRRQAGNEDDLIRFGELYLSISRQEGELLYLLARSSKAKKIVEFGASYGISTIYLAAAAADNGGEVITTEVHPKKCAAVRENLKRAGLAAHVTVIEGDARETLSTVEAPVDLVLLDGWKGMYLSVFDILRPKLSRGAVIAADNYRHNGVETYLEKIRAPGSGFTTVTLDDMALSCLTG